MERCGHLPTQREERPAPALKAWEPLAREAAALVADNGRGMRQAVMLPARIFSSLDGRSRMLGIAVGMDQRDSCTGDDADCERGELTLKYPVEDGIVMYGGDMMKPWHYASANECRVAPVDYAAQLMETPLDRKANRERLTQTVFEMFSAWAMNAAFWAVLSLYVFSCIAGVVMDFDGGVLQIVSSYGGYALLHVNFCLARAGRDCADGLMRIFMERCYFCMTAETSIVCCITEKLCYAETDAYI